MARAILSTLLWLGTTAPTLGFAVVEPFFATTPLVFRVCPPQELLSTNRNRGRLSNKQFGRTTKSTLASTKARIASSFSTRLFLEPLASEGDWTAYLDEEGTGLVYYFDGKTGESRWEPPTESFPEVLLTGRLRRAARRKQEEYLRTMESTTTTATTTTTASAATSTATTDVGGGGGGGGNGGISVGATVSPLSALTSPESQQRPEEEQKPSSTKKDQEDWFSFLLEDRIKNQQKAAAAVAKPPSVAETATNFFNNLFAARTTFGSTTTARNGASTATPTARSSTTTTTTTTTSTDMTTTTATPTISLTPSASSVTTTPPAEATKTKIEMSAYVVPHPAKILWGGEDAVFTKGRTFGIFDGVSGAAKLDGVPLYSKVLAREMKQIIPVDEVGLDVPSLTKYLNQAMTVADEFATGASTAVIASITADGYLRALNLGDSCCMVIRNGKIVAKTREISHYFDCPYQLSEGGPDRPRDGTKLNFELRSGDLIIMGSDGIFDNLVDDRIMQVVASIKRPNPPAGMIAKRIVDESRKISLSSNAETPYAKMAQRFGDKNYADGYGGKIDDISCVVVRYE